MILINDKCLKRAARICFSLYGNYWENETCQAFDKFKKTHRDIGF